MAVAQKDKYANLALASIAAAPGNCVNALLPTAININEKVGWLIHRVQIDTSAGFGAWVSGADAAAGIAAAPQSFAVTTSALIRPEVHAHIRKQQMSAHAVNLDDWQMSPWEIDLSSLPGGGKLVPPSPLYCFVDCSAAFLLPGTWYFRIYYTQIALSTEDYWDMVETYRTISA